MTDPKGEGDAAQINIYPLYVNKVEKKSGSKEELDIIIKWLTGYDDAGLENHINGNADLEAFFEQAPQINQNAHLIKGVICGHRVEDIEDPLTQKIRWMDKLVDELTRGKKFENILR
jgi:hypothetical protein